MLRSKLYTALLVAILSVAAFLRLYRLPQTLEFLSDQGRDALIVSRIFTEFDPVFIGPTTSVGNLYLGPGYYYFMLPWLWLSYPSPVGPAIAVAILGVITTWLIIRWGTHLVGRRAALFAGCIYALSAVMVQYNRFSWNPNIAPFLSLVLVWSLYQTLNKRPRYWLVVGLSLALLLQTHYLSLLVLPVVGLVALWQLYDRRSMALFGVQLAAAALFIASFLPLVLFDIKHGWVNLRGFQAMLSGPEHFNTAQVSVIARVLEILKETHGRGMHIFFEITIGQWRTLNSLLLVLVIVVIGAYLVRARYQRKGAVQYLTGVMLLSLFVVVSILGTAAYEHSIFHHYIAYLYPVSALLLGFVIDQLIRWQRFVGGALGLAFFGYLLVHNQPLLTTMLTAPGQIDSVRSTAAHIYDLVGPDEQYMIVLFSETGDFEGLKYRYFLSTTDRPPVPDSEKVSAPTIVTIIEPGMDVDPLNTPVYELVLFSPESTETFQTHDDGPELRIYRR